jgi:hypothetical protein
METSRNTRGTGHETVLGILEEGRTRAWLAVNAAMIETYESVGAWLSRKSREEGWDPSQVEALSCKLVAQRWGVLSVSAPNLMRMKTFHEVWSKGGGLPPQARVLPWECHLVLLEQCTTHRMRCRFLDAAVAGGWSAKVLETRIGAEAARRPRAKPIKSPYK